MNRVKSLLLFALAGAFVFTAMTVRTYADTVTVELTGVNGAVVGGVYADPYYGTINGQAATLVCDDYSHDTYMNESWTANVSTFPSLTNVRFGQPGSTAQLLEYEEAGYLYNTLLANPSDYGDISLALWGIFDSNLTTTTLYTNSNADYWADLAETNHGDAAAYSNLEILTPVSVVSWGDAPSNKQCGLPQEFITSVPEPASLFLVFGLMLGLALIRRRRQTA